MNANVPLSKLVASRANPRRVKPEREAHRKLVASLRAHGLLEPLVVRPENGHYRVIAGNRRLAALRVVHADDAAIPCMIRKVEADEAAELSLAENFAREPMHPLDEAEAFARLASVDRKGILAIAAEFGVSESYVRQRMKLATLCEPVKAAYREGGIDTLTAETFASVPMHRQEEIWEETGGSPRHAQHVRNLIENRWIDASLALFDVDALPAEAISTDLFRDQVLVERGAFMQAQAAFLATERERLTEEGWSEVVVAEQGDVQDRLYRMDRPEPDFTAEERERLEALEAKRDELERSLPEDAAESPELDALDREVEAIVRQATGRYSEATKARGTVFLILSPEGGVERHYRVERQRQGKEGAGSNGGGMEPEGPPAAPAAGDLTDRQRATVHAHEAIAVRHAVASNALIRKRLIVLALHDKVRTDAIALRHEANGTTVHAGNAEGFASPTLDALRAGREAIDPFKDERVIEEEDAYRRLCEFPEETLDRLIAVLIVDILSGHGQRETPLLRMLADELGVSVRTHWTPDAGWLAGYQKIQLTDLIGTLRSPAAGAAALRRKKSELVDELAAAFSQAASSPGGFADPAYAERLNRWMPGQHPD